MHGEWSPAELRAVLSAIQDEGLGQGEIADLAGVNRSQVNRWARGVNRPNYDPVLRLARRVARRSPDLASRLMSASGYAWDGRADTEDLPALRPSTYQGLVRDIGEEAADAVVASLRERRTGIPDAAQILAWMRGNSFEPADEAEEAILRRDWDDERKAREIALWRQFLDSRQQEDREAR